MILALNNQTNGFVQFLTVFVLFIIVLAICAFTTKFVAGYQKGKMMSGNIHVLETLKITNNKFIQIVQIGDKTYALGVSKDSITVIGELNEDSLIIKDDSQSDGLSFDTILQNAKNFKLKK